MRTQLITLLLTGLLLVSEGCESKPEASTKTPPTEAVDAGIEIKADAGPLEIVGFQVNEARFNPSPETPAALNIMSSLDFQNISDERLEVRSPRFTLKINGVEWTDLTSTDFQIGRLQPQASQGIELQSLLIVRKATEAQQAVIEAIKSDSPVELEITGTMLVYPGGTEQTINITLILHDVQLPGNWDHPTTN